MAQHDLQAVGGGILLREVATTDDAIERAARQLSVPLLGPLPGEHAIGVANAKARLEQRDADIAQVHARSERQERAFDEQEDQARVYRQAADEMREAERLDEAYTDLEARGVADADRVKEAAAAHRAPFLLAGAA